MSLISNIIAQNRAFQARFSGASQALSAGRQMSSAANNPFKALSQDTLSFSGRPEMQMVQANTNYLIGKTWEPVAKKLQDESIKSSFSTFA